MRVRGKNLVVTEAVTFQLTSSGRTYQMLLKRLSLYKTDFIPVLVNKTSLLR